MNDAPIVVMVSVPTEIVASSLAQKLVGESLAACVQALPMTSTYRWNGQIESASEILLLIKTRSGAYQALEAAVAELHPYDVPEIVSVPTGAIFGPYGDWLIEQTRRV